MMNTIILPKLVNCGIYDASITYPNCAQTKPRDVSFFEIDLPIEDGGIAYINDRKYPILKDHIICAKPGYTRHTRHPFLCHYVHLLVEPGALYDYLSSVDDTLPVKDPEAYRALFTDIINACTSPFRAMNCIWPRKSLH